MKEEQFNPGRGQRRIRRFPGEYDRRKYRQCKIILYSLIQFRIFPTNDCSIGLFKISQNFLYINGLVIISVSFCFSRKSGGRRL